MATNSEFAQLSSAAYQNDPASMQLPPGWSFFTESKPDPSGYKGFAFKNNTTGEIVIANRGVEPNSSLDRAAGLQMAANQLPDQYQYAKQFYIDVHRANGDAQITLTGDSLGGSLAQLLAAESTQPGNVTLSAVTFNPYGTKDLVSVLNARYGLSLDPNATYNNIVNHQTMLDGFSRLGSSSPFGSDQLGQMQTHVAASELLAAALIAGSALLGPESVVAFPATYVAVKFDWSHSIDRFTQEIYPQEALVAQVGQEFKGFVRTVNGQINAIEHAGATAQANLQNDFLQLAGTAGETYQDAVNATSSAIGKLADLLSAAEKSAAKNFLDLAFGLGNKINGIEQSVSDFLTTIQGLFHRAEITSSPLVLDLNGDGVSTVAMSAGVHFDQNNNRFSELSGWVAPSDGLLVRDLNGNGQIDGGSELFGNNTTLASGQKAANGFASLAELDTNHDGKVDSTEATAAGVMIWKDANQNGITDAGELLTLNQAGVSSLATGFTATSTVDAQGNTHGLIGSYTTVNGTVHAMDDVWFAVDTARTLEKDTVAVSAQIAALPDMAGFGNVHSLHQAMVNDRMWQIAA